MISIVIPAFNEEKNIKFTLDSLVNQDTDREFEIIVVDNNSTDSTASVVKSYADKMTVRVVEEKRKGRSPARRAGFAAAKGDIIFSTDADTVVPPDWIEKVYGYFSDPKVAAVTGACYINDCGWFVNQHFNFYQPVSMKLYRLLFGHYWLSGFNFAIRKSIYEQSGGFDPSLNSQEDTELAVRVRKVGFIKYVREPKVLFSGRRFHGGLLRGLWQYFSSYAMFFFFRKPTKTYLSDVR